jgi:hypothetical protein
MSFLLNNGIINQARNVIVEDGLILYMDSLIPRSYPGSGTNWNDISQSSITGTLDGDWSFSNGVITLNQASNNGRTNFSSLTSFDHTQPHTYISVIKPRVYPTSQAYYWIINNGSSTNGTSLVLQRNGFDITHSFITFFYNGGNNNFNTFPLSLVGSPSFSDVSAEVNEWVMIATVYDGSNNVTFYKNKTNLGTRTITSNPNFSSGNINPRLGAWQNGVSPYYGDIPIAMVYDRALSDIEIEKNFNAFRHRYGL